MARLGRGAVVLVIAAALSQALGCPCGMYAVPQANVVNGVVTFGSVNLGDDNQLSVLFQDSASASETITGATVTGTDAAAFTVVTSFPLSVPDGTQATVQIRFAPTHAGAATATLTLQTEDMGPSPVQLEGTGVGSGG